MKSQEYFQKYFENAKSKKEIAENCKAMFKDFLGEFSEIDAKRKPTTLDGVAGIVRELNEKWNSVAGKVEKKFSTQVIKRNVIWKVLLSEKWGELYPRKLD